MDILYIKLKNGTDIVSNTNIDGDNITLENPMAIRQYTDSTGRISLSFYDWVPHEFVDTSKFNISKEETLIICNTTSKVKGFYKECLKHSDDDSQYFNEEQTDAYSNLMKLLTNNRKLIH